MPKIMANTEQQEALEQVTNLIESLDQIDKIVRDGRGAGIEIRVNQQPGRGKKIPNTVIPPDEASKYLKLLVKQKEANAKQAMKLAQKYGLSFDPEEKRKLDMAAGKEDASTGEVEEHAPSETLV